MDNQLNLILWRHADAEDGVDDSARALTKRGRKQAAQIAAWLKERLPQDTEVLVSPAKRALQTAEALGLACRTTNKLGTGASENDVLEAAHWPHRDGTVVVVGHQPTLGRVAALVLSGKPSDWQIKKGALWWITCRNRSGQAEVALKAAMTPDLV